MNVNLLVLRLCVVISIGCLFSLYRSPLTTENSPASLRLGSLPSFAEGVEEEEKEEGEKMKYTRGRVLQELMMLRNPVTGTIPEDYRMRELLAASVIPEKAAYFNSMTSRMGDATVNNQYQSVGPNNIAGRSRALGIDRRNANILITGGVTGGIFRSTNGGSTWSFVMNENDIRNVNSIAQDASNPDTWYVGTGELYYPISASDVAGTFGHGIFKSTDNGASWTKLSATADNNEHEFQGGFDLVHRLAVHPTTGHVYAAVHNRIMRSTNGGATWETVLGGTVGNTAVGGVTEIIIASNGSKIFAAFSGENADAGLVGVWESASGTSTSWTRIAGAASGPGSVSGWRAQGQWGRPVLALNAANTQLFVLYKNGESAAGSAPKPEADLFRCDISSGTPASYTWTNLNAWVPDEPNFNMEGVDPYTTQFDGYNMSLAVKPNNDNILFIGGTAMHRVHLAETDAARKFRRIGGYGVGFFPRVTNFGAYPNHHPDVHYILFPPGSNDNLLTASDGGIHRTNTSVLADTVRWTALTGNLQTLQYQFINIFPDTEVDWIIGGTQDNGTLVNTDIPDPTHFQWWGGDGGSAAMTGFSKTGNTWKQSWYYSVVQGELRRTNFTFVLNGNTLEVSGDPDEDDITPSGQSGEGQWLTLFVSDPDNPQHLYYNSDNRLYRTTTASSVTPTTWTELTGVRNANTGNFSYMALSKEVNGSRYLYFGTASGRLYRLNNPNSTAATTAPVNITPSSMRSGSYVAGIAVNPRNPDTVLAVVSNYDAAGAVINNIFWTGNATAANPNWQVIDGALGPVSSQSCAIVATTSGIEYYVGTSVGLYSTTTINGASTQWLNEGSGIMKRAIIRSLVNRHKDNTLVVGTHGNGAFMANIGNAVSTGINDPIINDKNFITAVYPTLARDVVEYRTGNLFTIRRISVRLYNMIGQQVYRREEAYQHGSLNIARFAKGDYILEITSDNGKYKHIQKVVKQ